jgi:hypothetical protein
VSALQPAVRLGFDEDPFHRLTQRSSREIFPTHLKERLRRSATFRGQGALLWITIEVGQCPAPCAERFRGETPGNAAGLLRRFQR